MKRKFYWLAICAMIPAALGTLAACSGEETGVAPPYTGQHGETSGIEELEPPKNDVIKLDGILDEEIYETVAWKEWIIEDEDVASKKEETQTMVGASVRATVAYGEAGFYTSFEVKGSSVFVDLEHSRYRFNDTGISPYIGFLGTSHNYEIYLTADGEVGVSTYVAGTGKFGEYDLPGVFSSATVYDAEGNSCEINTMEADGYIIEAYFPWKAFGFDGPRAAVMMDVAAIMNFDSTSNSRVGWASMGEVYGTGWKWTDPSTYFWWSNGGFEASTALELDLKDYDEEGGTVSFVEEEYRALDDIALTIEPSSGYIIRSVKVNGEDRTGDIDGNVLTLTRYSDSFRVTVEVEFAPLPADRVTVTGTLKGVAGASEAWALPAGTKIAFFGPGRYEATLDAEGAYTAELPTGVYRVSVNVKGFENKQVEIEEAGEQEDIVLRWDLIGETTNYSVSEDESEATVVKLYGRAPLNVIRGDYAIFYTIKANPGVDYTDNCNMGLYFYYGSGEKDYYSLQYVGMNGSFVAKLVDAAAGDVQVGNLLYANAVGLTDAQYFAEHGQQALAVVEGNTLSYYICGKDGIYTKVSEISKAGGFSRGEIMNWTENAYFDDIAYVHGSGALNVEINKNCGAHGSLSFDKETYKMGEDIVITVSPEATYAAVRFTVNGVNRIGDLTAENTYTLHGFMGLSLSVEAEFALIPETEASGKAQAVAGAGAAWDIPDGTLLMFTSADGKTWRATVSEGAYTAHLPTGDYTVTAEGYFAREIVISEGSGNNLQLRMNMFADNGAFEISEDETTAAASTGQAYACTDFRLVGDEFVMFYTIRAKDGKTYASGSNMGLYLFYGEGPNDYYSVRYLNSSNILAAAMYSRSADGNDVKINQVNNTITAAELAENGQRCMIAVRGGILSYYVCNANGIWTKVAETSEQRTFVKGQIVHWTSDARFTDIAVYPGLDALNIKVNIGSFENGNITAEKETYVLGETVVLNIAPVSEYELKSLTVNGVERVTEVAEGKLTLTNFMGLTLDVEAEFLKPEQVEISGKVQAVAGASKSWDVPDTLTQMTFRRVTGEEVTATVENGQYTAANIKTGTYTVTATGYLPATVTIEQGGTDKDITLRWDLIAETDKYTVNEEETRADALAATNSVDVNLTGGDFVMFVTIKAKNTSFETYDVLGGSNAYKTSYRCIQFVSTDGAANDLYVSMYRYYMPTVTTRYAVLMKGKMADDASAPGRARQDLKGDYAMTDPELLSTGMRTMCVLKGTTFSVYLKPTSGTNAERWVLLGKIEDVSGFSKASFTGTATSNRRFDDIAYYRGTAEFDALGLES